MPAKKGDDVFFLEHYIGFEAGKRVRFLFPDTGEVLTLTIKKIGSLHTKTGATRDVPIGTVVEGVVEDEEEEEDGEEGAEARGFESMHQLRV